MRNIIFIFLFHLLAIVSFGQAKQPSKSKILGKGIIKGSAGYSLSKISFIDIEKKLQSYYRNAVRFNIDINPYKDFYLKTNMYFDVKPPTTEPIWIADFSYQVGVYNWRKNTFSYGYENYGPNRFSKAPVPFFDNLKRGHLFVRYKMEISKKGSVFFQDETSKISIEPFIRVNPEYADSLQNTFGYGKLVTGTAISYTVFKNIYVESAVYLYPIKGSKLPWDPDYTYGFGIYNWQPLTVNFTYGNYIANRFSKATQPLKYHRFMNGEFRVFLNFSL